MPSLYDLNRMHSDNVAPNLRDLQNTMEYRRAAFWLFAPGIQGFDFLFHFGFTARQVYFTHFEQSQSFAGAKTGDPREKTTDYPQAEHGLSHMWPKLGSNPQRLDDRAV